MSHIAGKLPTLRERRDALGLSAQAVADKVAQLLGEPSRTGQSITNIENRGCRDHYVIKALAKIFSTSEDEMAEITAPTDIQNKLLSST